MNVAFKTVGCRLNQAETAAIRARFEDAGFRTVPFGGRADVVVIHTCSVTEKAEKNCIREARSCRRRSPSALVVLAGCAVEVSADRLRRESGADLQVGQKDKFRLPELVAAHLDIQPVPAARSTPPPAFATVRAIIRIQDGCDFCCTYCIVPKTRGQPVSRPAADIVDEARRLADAGFREVVLTGANLVCYRDGGNSLVKLIERLEAIPAIARIRLSSLEPSATQKEVIRYLPDSAKLCPHLHIPMQSGDDGILKAMGRHYTAREFQTIVESAVEGVPRLGLGTDLIVGFPGEDDTAFNHTLRLVHALPFSNLHVFQYSARPGTAAATMEHPVPVKKKKARSAALIQLGDAKRKALGASFVGQRVSVLIEKIGHGEGHGWTGEYLAARIRGGILAVNQIVECHVQAVEDGTLIGTLASTDEPGQAAP